MNDNSKRKDGYQIKSEDFDLLRFYIFNIPKGNSILYIADNEKDEYFANNIYCDGRPIEVVYVDRRIENNTDYSFNPCEMAANLGKFNSRIKVYFIKEKETFSIEDGIPSINGLCYTLDPNCSNIEDGCQFINSKCFDYIIYRGIIYEGIEKSEILGHNKVYTRRRIIENERSN